MYLISLSMLKKQRRLNFCGSLYWKPYYLDTKQEATYWFSNRLPPLLDNGSIIKDRMQDKWHRSNLEVDIKDKKKIDKLFSETTSI